MTRFHPHVCEDALHTLTRPQNLILHKDRCPDCRLSLKEAGATPLGEALATSGRAQMTCSPKRPNNSRHASLYILIGTSSLRLPGGLALVCHARVFTGKPTKACEANEPLAVYGSVWTWGCQQKKTTGIVFKARISAFNWRQFYAWGYILPRLFYLGSVGVKYGCHRCQNRIIMYHLHLPSPAKLLPLPFCIIHVNVIHAQHAIK